MPKKHSQFKLQLVAESDMTATLDQAIRELLCRCFPVDVEAFSQDRAWHESIPDYSVVYQVKGSVLGHIGMVLRDVRCGADSATVAGVQNLCVAPEQRHTGLSQQLMARALEEAECHGLLFGLLFCVPELKTFYGSMDWRQADAPVTMLDDHGHAVPLPAKNITLYKELSPVRFPEGPIDLGGRDW